jgi:hypothetical protein
LRPARTLRAGIFVAPSFVADRAGDARALIAALEDTAPDPDAPKRDKALGGDLSAIKQVFGGADGNAPSRAAGPDADTPQEVIFAWKRGQ